MLRALALVLALVLGVAAAPVLAQSDRVAQEWDKWLKAQGNPPGALVFLIGDSLLLGQDSGFDPDLAVPIASLSKGITGLCAQALVDEGLMAWDDLLNRWIEGGGTITLAQLVTHTSGLWPDETQGAMALWRGDTTRRWQEVTANALDRDRQGGRRGSYRYNNENYAILGLVIEEVAGEWYDKACASRVLEPLGITTARLSPEYGGYGPWGGWQMSVRDYARLMRGGFATMDPRDTPSASLGGGAFYGLGMLFRTGRDTANHWHFGALCFEDAGLGAFAVNWAGKYTVVAAYGACVDGKAMAGLDAALARAVFAD
ncbi:MULTISPECIES: serine hydrolase domain-containing protein [Mameliella]|uniref:serine hydrolase domain-containing protein n=1 Tax=Mameliella TaxID=1434019 RepID=UPI0012FF5BF7|nr:serine hydrolase [Mameliella alba]MCR9273654.1 beta-lactamase family protein [Paracoccaceae bacterium]